MTRARPILSTRRCVCGQARYPQYRVTDRTWAAAGLEPSDRRCLECFEQAIGRPVCLDDLRLCPLTATHPRTRAMLMRLLCVPTTTPETFDPTERAREKQASRDEDVQALATGEKTVEQLRKENAAFAFPRSRVRIKSPRRA